MQWQLKTKEITFNNGVTITFKEPTLAQVQNAKTKARGNDEEVIKYLAVDCSEGEITLEDMRTCPMSEAEKIASAINELRSNEVPNP